MDDPVRGQYEAYPYPARDPGDEARRLVTGSPSHILELDHYLFGGRRDFRRPFRALFAGGGTGDGAVMLAQQLADAGSPAEVVYIDVSRASRAIAEARAEARGLGNLVFRTLSLLDLPGAGQGVFDYIDCCGVLHHLEDPARGLEALTAVLAADGGMGLMLYGELGRTGVYPFQDMMRLLAPKDPAPARVELARRLLERLPATNWLRRNPFVRDHVEGGDAGLHDLLLPVRDRAYRVPGIAELAARAGLSITAFIEPAAYDPASYLNDPSIVERTRRLDWIERCALAELLAGNMRTHVFYAVREGAAATAVASPEDPGAVPRLRDLDGETFARGFKPGTAMTAELGGLTLRFPMPPLAAAMVARMDGARTMDDIRRDLAAIDPGLDEDAFGRQFRLLYTALNGLGKLYLGFPAGA